MEKAITGMAVQGGGYESSAIQLKLKRTKVRSRNVTNAIDAFSCFGKGSYEPMDSYRSLVCQECYKIQNVTACNKNRELIK